MAQKVKNKYIAIDLFAGCGGLSEGMFKAGFDVKVAIDNHPAAVETYRSNHPKTKVINQDIRNVTTSVVVKKLKYQKLHFLAGCPPCQGFSSVRRLNRKQSVYDKRNSLILEYLRFVRELMPLTIMMENVPGLMNYYLFADMVKELKSLGYSLKFDIINVKNYGVPQRRKRLVLVGSLLGEIDIARGDSKKITVRNIIGKLPTPCVSKDSLHKIIANHTPRIQKMIALIPKDGGSRNDLPRKYILTCHKRQRVGFKDIYGRLAWDDLSSTITSGCLNPSKGRFLHPAQDRVITPREAALLQSFPKRYKFPTEISKASLSMLIGNALPPKFSFAQCKNIKKHLDKYLG